MSPRCHTWITLIVILIIPLCLFSKVGNPNSSFSLLSSSNDGVQIKFQLPAWELERVNDNGDLRQRIKVENTPYLFIDEQETLPVFSTMIAIPYSGGATLSVTNRSPQNQQPLMADFDSALSSSRNKGEHYGSLYPQAQVSISEPQVIRDFRVVTINVYPFQYDQDGKKLNTTENFDLQITYNSNPSVNEIAPPQEYSRSFESIYRGLILNYNEAVSRNAEFQNPVMLVIYGYLNDPTYTNKLNEYIAWKKQKGYKVYSVSAVDAGTEYTNIKNYIQNAYNTWEDRPEYVVLVGDASGTITVKTNGYNDYQYTWLAGGDNLGDVIIGRISVDTAETFIKYVNKVLALERDIDLSNAVWLNRMVLVGDTASSGISTIYTNQYIQDVSYAANNNYAYTTQYNGSPSNTIVNAAINNPGVAFYNYRGYLGMSGWPGTMSSMYNGNKLFHAVFITCDTGTFSSGTATTEAVIRYGTSPTNFGGAITAIGMATTSTHTPMNNCLDVGIFHGIYNEQMRDMGSAMLYSKLYLNAVYGVTNPASMLAFSQYCNLMGDPTASVYVGIPDTFSTNAPASIDLGTTNVAMTVTSVNREVVSGASVAITNGSGLQALGYTDESGYVLINIPTGLTGSLVVTISKDDFKPLVSTITINGSGGIVYDSAVIDDDTATGDGDGIVNAGEEVNLYVTLKNTTSSTVFLTADVACNDPYVNMIVYDRIEFNSIAPNAYGENESPIVLSVAPNCPDNHQFVLELAIEGDEDNWVVNVPIAVRSGKLEIQGHSFVGAAGNVIYPGNVFPFTLSLKNTGMANLYGLSGVLRSFDNYVIIQDSLGFYGNIPVNSTISNSGNTFEVYARGACIEGMVIPLELQLSNANGFNQTLYYTITIGQTSVTDPLGQDAYGYFIFDQGDTAYLQCPTYQWIPIAPAEGGSGTLLSLTDPGAVGDEGDQVGAVSIQTVNLPFPFTFYGVSYSQASISSNGFIAFGATQNSDWRNWRLPGAGGPNPMIAVFWDDLELDAGSAVYTYHNAAMHYFVVEWYSVVSGYDRTSRETFQAILYDPMYYPTQTNDGQIKLQYKLFNNIDLGYGDTNPHGKYCTIGIKNHTGTVGLEYTFNNTYPTAAAPLANEKALFITTRAILSDNPHLVIQQVTVLDNNGNGYLEPGESSNLNIQLRNVGLTNATNVSATLSTTDPYATVLAATVAYGSIPSESSVTPAGNYGISIAANCPNGHIIPFTLTITGSGETWIYVFSEIIHAPILGFGDITVNDINGDLDGNLDPGETATISIPISNTGLVASTAGSAVLTCSTTGITVVNGNDGFGVLSPSGSEVLTFTISASGSMTIGTLATLEFNATAAGQTATKSTFVEIGAPTIVAIGSGTSIQTYPLDRYYNYSAHEAIYLAGEIGMGGTIKSIAYYKASGNDVSGIEAVSIYMKNTSATSLSNGTYSLTGYTLVYNGTFTNNDTSGWMEVNLDTMFSYGGTQNLAVLCVKGYQQWINYYPQWTYTNAASNRARQGRSDSDAPTTLSATTDLPNVRFKIFPNPAVLYPPQNLTATPSNMIVSLGWQAPVSGTPTGYKIYRNSNLLTTVTGLSYNDTAVTNGTTYNYYLKAAFAGGDSDPTETVSATPNALSPTNLVATAGNQLVNLTWTAPSARDSASEDLLATSTYRAISGYRVYRNSTAITTVTGTAYLDNGLTNGVQYTYYVTTVYANPAGESAPSNTVVAVPAAVSQVIIGSGTAATGTQAASPVNVYWKSLHGQSVYTAAELNSAGMFGPVYITQLGFNITGLPTVAMPNFVVRMKHTTASNVASWIGPDNLITVHSIASYLPTTTGYNMYTFTTPFLWNGTDNLLVDTAFSVFTPPYSSSGQVQYSTVASGYRYTRNDDVDQTNVFTGGSTSTQRPNIKMTLSPYYVGPMITVAPPNLSYGAIAVGSNSTQQFTIQNTGDLSLTGSITTPAGYTVAIAREDDPDMVSSTQGSSDRNTLPFSIPPSQTYTYNLTFAPSAAIAYNGNVLISSNAVNSETEIIALTGSGFIPQLDVPVVSLAMVGNTVLLTWNTISNADYYKVYKSSSPYGTFQLLGTTSLLQYTDTAPDRGFYYVKAGTNPPARDTGR